MSARRSSGGSRDRRPGGSARASVVAGHGYLAESERPVVSLYFLLPLILTYELYAMGWIGTRADGRPADSHITAFVLIDGLFHAFGAAGRHFPALALVGMLLAAHLARRDPWRVRLSTLAGMVVEAVFWAMPLVVLGWAVSRYWPLLASQQLAERVVLSMGAGIYEEMLFRLIGMSVLGLVLRDLMGFRPPVTLTVTLITLGVLFSLYHYLGGREQFLWGPFTFRALAGVYLGGIYALRGFGITAGSHASYDLVVTIAIGS